jgi:ParB-like chromosome segregation protein Spo0J
VKKKTLGTCEAEERMAVSYREISQLILDAQNPRLHSPKQVRQIARSIQAFGFVVPVLVDAKLGIVAGHGRVDGLQTAWTQPSSDHLASPFE